MSDKVKKQIKIQKRRSYLNKDFNSFRAELLKYARTYFPDKIRDFSDASVGGLFLDMAAHVGDTMSYYLDHQFHELNVSTAIESANIERHIRTAGVEMIAASPAVVEVDFYIKVPAIRRGGDADIESTALPTIRANSVLKAKNGTPFATMEDIDFSAKDQYGDYKAEVTVNKTNTDGSPKDFLMRKTVTCLSGELHTESFNIGNNLVPFRTITLGRTNVSQIAVVRDSSGNEYFEVPSLVNDIVFKRVLNLNDDNQLVPYNLEVAPAPYRFVRETSPTNGATKLRFGAGDAGTLDDDVLPDPSELALPLYGKQTFARFSIVPGNLLKTKTLGISPTNTTITVTYRHGGGLKHNVASETITNVSNLRIDFPYSPSATTARSVRNSVSVSNPHPASGGEPAATLAELKSQVTAYRNSQSRIITKQDLLSRIYTMPSEFGSVFRAGIRPNPNNPMASELYIVSRTNEGKLTHSPDALKDNLKIYLNEFRIVSDAIDILDAKVINLALDFEVMVDPRQNKSVVLRECISKLKTFFDIKHFQIDQALVISEVYSVLAYVPGVISVVKIEFSNRSSVYRNRNYSDVSFNVKSMTKKGFLICPGGGIFEVRYSDKDITGTAS